MKQKTKLKQFQLKPLGNNMEWIIVYQMGRLCGGAHEISGIHAPLFLHEWVVGGFMGWVVGGWCCVMGGWWGGWNGGGEWVGVVDKV